MKTINPDTTVGEIVRAVPSRSRIFENLGIDYCCGGKKPLAPRAPQRPSVNPDAMGLSELCDHIEFVHHGYLKEELPRLDFMTRKVAAVHGGHEPRLLEVRRAFETFNAEMTAHTKGAEETIFPAIRQLEAAAASKTTATPNLKASFAKLESEHESAGAALARFKELTDHYTPPEWACNTFRALYDGLRQMEKDMHLHVHKENNVLFPRVLAIGGSA